MYDYGNQEGVYGGTSIFVLGPSGQAQIGYPNFVPLLDGVLGGTLSGFSSQPNCPLQWDFSVSRR